MKQVLAAVAAFAIVSASWSGAVAGPPSPPFTNVTFLVRLAGQTQSVQVDRVGNLIQKTETVSAHPGGSATGFVDKSPGLSSIEPITLERGLSQDLTFAHWADEPATASDFRRDVDVILLDQQRNPIVVFGLSGCWVSAYRAFSALDANGAPVTEQLTLQCDHWTRSAP